MNDQFSLRLSPEQRKDFASINPRKGLSDMKKNPKNIKSPESIKYKMAANVSWSFHHVSNFWFSWI